MVSRLTRPQNTIILGSLATLIAGALIAVSCNAPNTSPPSDTTATAISKAQEVSSTTPKPAAKLTGNVQLAIAPESTLGGGVRIVGTSNLPDGTVILTAVFGTGDNLAFREQAESVIKGGHLEGGPFGSKSVSPNGLKSGLYTILTVCTPGAQPASIRAALGQDFEKLHGPLVSRINVPELGPAVVVRTQFHVDANGHVIRSQ